MRLDNEEFLGFCVGARQKEYSAPTHLEAEWRKAGFEQAIHLRNGLSEFVDSFVKPALQQMDELKHSLSQGVPIDLAEYLRGQFDAVFEGVNSKLTLDRQGGTLEEPFGVSGLSEKPRAIDVLDVLALDGNNVYVEFVAEYEATAFAYVFKSSAASINDLSRFQVSDADWNEHYAEVEGEVILEVTIGMTFDPSLKTVSSFEVGSAEDIED